jgi:hypothetical protein
MCSFCIKNATLNVTNSCSYIKLCNLYYSCNNIAELHFYKSARPMLISKQFSSCNILQVKKVTNPESRSQASGHNFPFRNQFSHDFVRHWTGTGGGLL